MMKIIFLAISLGLAGIAKTQTNRLTIGDKVPDVSFNIFEKAKPAKVSGYKKRLVILDFWATWCGSCIGYFEKMEHLQDQFSADMKVLLVNSIHNDDAGKIKKTYKDWEKAHQRPLRLETVIGDKQFKTMFPYRSLPYYVWVLDGMVKGITTADEVSAANIEAVLNNPNTELTLLVEMHDDKPLYLMDALPLNRLQGFSILTKGRTGGVGRGWYWKKNDAGAVVGYKVTNTSLFNAYKYLVAAIDERLGQNKRVMLKVKDSTSVVYSGSSLSKDEWEVKNLVNFEFIAASADSLIYTDALRALNVFSGFNGYFSKQRTKCLILTQVGSTDSLFASGNNEVPVLGNPTIINAMMSALIKRMDEQAAIPFPAIDETHITQRVNMRFKRADFLSLTALNAALLKYGLQLKEEERELDMFIIAD